MEQPSEEVDLCSLAIIIILGGVVLLASYRKYKAKQQRREVCIERTETVVAYKNCLKDITCEEM